MDEERQGHSTFADLERTREKPAAGAHDEQWELVGAFLYGDEFVGAVTVPASGELLLMAIVDEEDQSPWIDRKAHPPLELSELQAARHGGGA
ncbi:uncharacterized protein EMH_0098300 [Eimeria mitis]|uniref:Uncharacterized protein n=1 Tax=Eimeria mitis TaxID=44415 RepID=U6KJD1_9EIME|nr:uncharacterized protein EMH_0098300 [Eimeria mitis]CDJ36896.1 hypothetical protein EMH_0098300 [Eimeria mitis]